MNKIKLSKKFYTKSILDKAIKEFKDLLKVKEEGDCYALFSEDKIALLEFSNYLLAIKEK